LSNEDNTTATITLDEVVAGDCLDVMRGLPGACIDLVYLDPPFNTGRRLGGSGATFDDRWETVEAYLAFMEPRVREAHRLLLSSGSILLHCDWRTSHHLRLLLDTIFGADHFVNHLIWRYGLGGSSSRRFARKHDDILFYGRTRAYHFTPPRVPATSQRMLGLTKKATDVLDVPAINNMAHERSGYPAQKPLALLRILVEACAPPGGIVLDPFCGSGTTAVAAATLDRRFIAVDRNPDAVEIARERVGKVAKSGEGSTQMTL
jgi:DNA modification methylase